MDADTPESSDLAGLGGRIAKIADLVGGKKTLAQAIGISESQLYRYISGDSQPTVEPLAAIAKCGSVPLDWLVLGSGSSNLLTNFNGPGSAYDTQNHYINVAEYKDGDQSEQPNAAAVVMQPSFSINGLRASGLNPDHLRLSSASDDAMAPTINNGDVILLDISQSQFSGDAIYLLRLERHILAVKRLQYSLDQGLLLINDNPAYENQLISSEQKNTLEIIGKVVWAAGFL